MSSAPLSGENNNKLFQIIFSLTNEKQQLRPLQHLRKIVGDILTELKRLKVEGRLMEITGVCYQNDKLKLLSRVLRQDYFTYNVDAR